MATDQVKSYADLTVRIIRLQKRSRLGRWLQIPKVIRIYYRINRKYLGRWESLKAAICLSKSLI
jgi:hypothetical protein